MAATAVCGWFRAEPNLVLIAIFAIRIQAALIAHHIKQKEGIL